MIQLGVFCFGKNLGGKDKPPTIQPVASLFTETKGPQLHISKVVFCASTVGTNSWKFNGFQGGGVFFSYVFRLVHLFCSIFWQNSLYAFGNFFWIFFFEWPPLMA